MYTKEKATFYQVVEKIEEFRSREGMCPNSLSMSYEKYIELLKLAMFCESGWFISLKDEHDKIRMYFMGLEIEISQSEGIEVEIV